MDQTQHLTALSRVVSELEAAEIDYWLFGGWAVDFYVGSVTRPHDDLDVAVWTDDVRRIADLLERDGWRHAPAADEDGGTGYERHGVRLELTYLDRAEDGQVVTPLRSGLALWPPGAFADDVRELSGVRCRLLGLTALIASKTSARGEASDVAKDRDDLKQLRNRAGDRLS